MDITSSCHNYQIHYSTELHVYTIIVLSPFEIFIDGSNIIF